jgi:nicotinate-nucleotide adenylyltransferase
MERIGIFGGSFNPPHIAHLIGAEIAREALDLDRVILIPAAIPPHKQRMDLPSGEIRLWMLEAAIESNPCFEASDIELTRSGPSYTVDTLRQLKAKNAEAQLVLLIGMDNLEIFDSWRSSDEILSLAEVAVMVRPGHSTERVKPELLERVKFVEIPLLDISGTAIRERVRSGKSIHYWVPTAVERIIESEGLYQNDENE